MDTLEFRKFEGFLSVRNRVHNMKRLETNIRCGAPRHVLLDNFFKRDKDAFPSQHENVVVFLSGEAKYLTPHFLVHFLLICEATNVGRVC